MARLTPTRHADRSSSTDRAALDDVLDSVRIAHVGLMIDDEPLVIPTAFARQGDQLLLHGSTGSRWMRAAAHGAPLCVTVTELTALVVARSAFESSMHYRSAVLFGPAHQVPDERKRAALDALTEHLIPGRTAEIRPSTPKELAATVVLALPIRDWSLKVANDWPDDPPEDVAGPAWAGVVPLLETMGAPDPAPDLRPGLPVPPSVGGTT